MHNYPECVPSEFVYFYESEFLFGKGREIAHCMIFDERFLSSWSALGKRANEWRIPFFFYQSLVLTIESALNGPSGWDLLTQKEKENKIDKIKNLARSLSDEINGTPLDEPATEYFNHKYYLNRFKNNSNDEMAINRMNYHLDKFCEEGEFSFKSKDDSLGVSGAWSFVGVDAPHLSVILDDLYGKAKVFECSSIIKRKTNPRKSFFVRKISAFFEDSFGLKLYALTAAISSVFLDEDITQEEVISITR